jgi:prevent-host-death family protein
MRTKEIGTLEAKTRLSEVLSEVERGQCYYITRHGKRVAHLAPVTSRKRRPQFGCGKGMFTYVAADFDEPLEDFKEYTE